ncbi:cobalamin B12-binding domain-containing protein [Actinomycetospora straminea]|uniref:Cobalamin-dependent protein n=1 Tax=Actinomycetospora straminea TaxID=663607 RepID=A0ABP9EFQ9_9PSEU|nr:cobalamin-dependent protein [Actinomycetospora straminea]MDD7933348.1 cobalamin-dependent protein [Actinomycetospora straminea]
MTTTSPPTDPVALRAAYLERLAASDEPGAVAVALGALDAGVDAETVLLDVVAGAQREVGDLWAAGEWTVVQEHVATHISERVVAAVAQRAPAPASSALGKVAVACLDGEWHGLPARLLAEVLARHGWAVEFLGASVPAAQLATHLHRAGPDVVAISSSLPSRLPAARRMVEACHATGTPVLAGGAAFGEDGRWARAVGADGWAPDGRAAAAMLAADPDGPWFADEAATATGTPGDVPAREEQAVLHARRAELVRHVAAALRPETAGGPVGTVPDELADDLGHLVDFLAAAVFVDDPGLFDGFVRWVGTVTIPDGLRTGEVAAALDALAAALADSPRTVRLLRSAPGAHGGQPATVG